jgi:L-amino acid N-acyltransferase YncA
MSAMNIRPATSDDSEAIWQILEPMIRAGETYTLPRDMSRDDALQYWAAPGHEVFVAEEDAEILGTYFLRENYRAAGSHIANCGYVTAVHAAKRGIGHAMCKHSIERARGRGFRAMQFNFVVASNDRAVRIWQDCGFETIGRIPAAFRHPHLGLIDALIMYRKL